MGQEAGSSWGLLPRGQRARQPRAHVLPPLISHLSPLTPYPCSHIASPPGDDSLIFRTYWARAHNPFAPAPPQLHASWWAVLMLGAWAAAEVIRYPWYAAITLGACPGWLTWLR